MSDWTPEPVPAPEVTPDVTPGAGPHAPAPLGITRTSTGDTGVDERLGRLADADHLPAGRHIQVYEDVHRELCSALTALDARHAPAPPYDDRS